MSVSQKDCVSQKDRERITQYYHQRALNYLARYNTSSHKLSLYLQRKATQQWGDSIPEFIPLMVQSIIVRLQKLQLLDDMAFGRGRMRHYQQKNFASSLIKTKLSLDGLDKDTIEQLLYEAKAQGELDEMEMARQYAKSKQLGRFHPDFNQEEASLETQYKQQQKSLRKMAARGFGYELAKRALYD